MVCLMWFFHCVLLSVISQSTICKGTAGTASIPKYLQNELISIGKSQQSIVNFLSQKNIRIGHQSFPINKLKDVDFVSRIALSTKDNPLVCRISLGLAPEGALCVAPCGCTGSQKWIQFSEYNKLRRSDPTQWQVCKTCQQDFQTEPFTSRSGLRANVVGILLDNMYILRSVGVLSALGASYVIDLNAMISRVLTSRIVWQNHQHWSKLVNTPLALKFMLGRIAFDQLSAWYSQLERATLFAYLTGVETALIEEGLQEEISRADQSREEQDDQTEERE